ncbi:MAG: DUF3298 domain-containing protein [Bacteroidales bacterium]|nr:DUF3298 domain-containing protein [Bacteroidales bacterium]
MKHCTPFIFVLGILTCVACSNSTGQTQKQISFDSVTNDSAISSSVSNKFSIDSVIFADSIYIGRNDNRDSVWAHVDINCSYPYTDNPNWQMAKKNILYWICDIFDDSTHYYWNNCAQLVSKYGRKELNRIKEEFSELCIEDTCMILNNYLEHNIDCKLLFENDSLITFGVGVYVFMDGAHGSYLYEGKTFNKNTGHVYNFDLLSKYDKNTLNNYMLKGLLEYFGSEDELSSLSDISDIHNIPLPSASLYVTEKGINFIYQQYEIACYAAGMPSFVIPLK